MSFQQMPIFSMDVDTIEDYYPRVIRHYQVEKTLYLHIPACYIRNYLIFQIDQVCPKYEKLDVLDKVDTSPNRPWILVDSFIFDFSIGMHKYRIHMVNKHTNDVIELYFGYIVQNDEPDRPYIYMEELAKEGILDEAITKV